MQKQIKFKFGNYNLSCIHENGNIKPTTGIFSKLSPIPVNDNMNLYDFIGEILKKFEKEHSTFIKMDNDKKIKKFKMEGKGEHSYRTIFTSGDIHERNCEEIMEKIENDKLHLLDFGTYAEIYDLGDGLIVRREKCTTTYDNSEEFIEKEKEEIEISKPLIKANLTPKIHQISVCDKYCIVIMDKIDGYTAVNKLTELLYDLDIESEEDGDPEEFASILISIKKFILSIVDAIIKFHKIMKANGYDIGHGDLHLGNIMIESKTGNIKFIDLGFNRDISIKDDWDVFYDDALHFYLIEKFQNDIDFNEDNPYLNEEFAKKDIIRLKKMSKPLKKLFNEIGDYYDENIDK